MRLDRSLKRFKRLAEWIRVELPRIENDGKKWKAFLHYGQFTPGAARKALRVDGSNPTLDVAMLPHYGEFYRKRKERNRHKIHLNREMCRKFNRIPPDHRDFDFELLMEATILHEIVHWGDARDGHEQPDRPVYDTVSQNLVMRDVGFQFEEAAYYSLAFVERLRAKFHFRTIKR